MKYLICAGILPLCLAIATPLKADPTIGLGFTLYFGGNDVHPGFGVRVFSDNERDSAAWSIGVDYMPQDGTWRGTLGGGWLGTGSYVGLDMGFGFSDGTTSFGVSTGVINTVSPPAPQVANPVPVALPQQVPPPQIAPPGNNEQLLPLVPPQGPQNR